MEFAYEITDDEGYDLELTIKVFGLESTNVYEVDDGRSIWYCDVSFDSFEATLDGKPYEMSEQLELRIADYINENADVFLG
jgi:hypothetical protein